MSKRVLLLLMAALTCMFIFAGCGGDDGDDADPAVTDALQAQIEALEAQLAANEITLAEYQAAIDALESDAEGRVTSESCSVCHDSGSVNAPAHGTAGYVLKGDLLDELGDPTGVTVKELVEYENAWSITVTNIVDNGGGSLDIEFDFTSTDSTTLDIATDLYSRTYVSPYDSVEDIFTRTQVAGTLADDGDGTYTLTTAADVDVAAAITANTPLLVYFGINDADGENFADHINRGALVNGAATAVIFDSTGALADFDSTENPRNYVSDESCSQCHGTDEFNYHHNNVVRANMASCAGCHTIDDDVAHISKISSRVHGIHNSAGYLADGADEYGYEEDGDGNPLFNIGFPNDMSDCQVCHTSAAQLANATAQEKFTLETCVSCHGSWDEILDNKMDEGAQAIHDFFDPATDACEDCHGPAETWDDVTIADIHNGTEYMQHKIAAESIEYRILSASVTDGVASVTWQAVDPTDADDPYDILNAEKNGEPNFLADLEFGLNHGPSFDVAFFTGDDITNQGATTRDGQPDVGASFTTENTVAGDVAGTYVTTFEIPSTVTATRAYFNIQGQPNIFADADDEEGLAATVASAVYAFNVADGAAADARRSTTDIDLCLDCHGTLSLHGGNRINSIETCVICHNPNATDLTGRNSYGEDVDTALDGKTQSSYDLKVMIHSIHAATLSDEPYYVYRSRGIYGFRGESELPATFGVGDASWNDVHVEYPRNIGSCTACHTSNSIIADQAEALAVTIDQGADLTTHDDDTVIGPNAAACSSCHKGEISSTASINAHLDSFGFETSYTTKDAILEAAE